MRRSDPITVTAVGLAGVAFAGSFTHVQEVVSKAGQGGWLSYAIASMPEVSVLLALLKIRRARAAGDSPLWAWVVGSSSAAFTLSANLATAQPSPWGYVAAGWPAWASVGATLLTHTGRQEPPRAPEPVRPPVTPPQGPRAAHAAPQPALAAEQRRPVVEAVITDAPRSARGKTDDELYADLLEAIRTCLLPASPSAEAIRVHLRCAPDRARGLRDRIRGEDGPR